MKNFLLYPALLFAAALAWRIGSLISADALAMAIGVLFGILAGIPVSLLVLAGQRSATRPDPYARPVRDDRPEHLRYSSPPAVILQPPGAWPAQERPGLPARRWQEQIADNEQW